MPTSTFVGLTLAQLQTLQTSYLAAITALAEGIQSYSIGGRSVTRVDLPSLTATLADINYALGLKNGSRKRRTLGRFSKPTY